MSEQALTVQDEQKARVIDIFKAQLEKAAPMILPLLPAHITADKFKSMVVTTIAFNPKLQECTMPSLLRSVADAAELGLSLNPNLKEADILPVWGKNGTVAQLRPRYNGLMKLARQSGEIIDLYAHEVYSNDTFSFKLGLNKDLIHEPAEGDRGHLTFAYVVWETKLHVKGFEVVDSKRIARAKAASEGFKSYKAGRIKSTPWVDDESEMWRKTAVRAGSKYMAQSTESEHFRRAAEMIDPAIYDDDERIGVPTAPAIARPTREASRAAVDNIRKEQVQREGDFRQTMADDAPGAHQAQPEEPHDPQTGEITDTPGEPTQATETAQEGQDEVATETATKPTATADHNAVDSLIRRKVASYKTLTMIDAMKRDYADDLALMKSEDRPRWDALKAVVDARVAEIKK